MKIGIRTFAIPVRYRATANLADMLAGGRMVASERGRIHRSACDADDSLYAGSAIHPGDYAPRFASPLRGPPGE